MGFSYYSMSPQPHFCVVVWNTSLSYARLALRQLVYTLYTFIWNNFFHDKKKFLHDNLDIIIGNYLIHYENEFRLYDEVLKELVLLTIRLTHNIHIYILYNFHQEVFFLLYYFVYQYFFLSILTKIIHVHQVLIILCNLDFRHIQDQAF